MKKYFNLLQKCPLFFNITPQELPKALACLHARVSSLHKGEVILNEGEPVNDVGIVLRIIRGILCLRRHKSSSGDSDRNRIRRGYADRLPEDYSLLP